MAFSFGSRYGTTGKLFTVDTTDFTYHSLEELYTKLEQFYGGDTDAVESYQFQLRGIYINTKSYFGDAPVFATDDGYVNVPESMLSTALDMKKDRMAINAINNGQAGFTIYKYTHPKYGRVCYNVRLCDYAPKKGQPVYDMMMDVVRDPMDDNPFQDMPFEDGSN